MDETHFIEKCAREYGRNVIASSFKTYVGNLINLDYHIDEQIDEQMLALIRTAVEVADRLDADMSIAWISRGSALDRTLKGEISHSNFISNNVTNDRDFSPGPSPSADPGGEDTALGDSGYGIGPCSSEPG